MASPDSRLRVTLDTSVLPADDFCRAAGDTCDFAVVTVTAREAGSAWEVRLNEFDRVLESGVFDESPWDNCVWAADDDPLETLLDVIANGSFPREADRHTLSTGQRSQLRDAMILAVHIRAGRDILVTNDAKAFINHGRRESLHAAFSVTIMTSREFLDYLVSRQTAAI